MQQIAQRHNKFLNEFLGPGTASGSIVVDAKQRNIKMTNLMSLLFPADDPKQALRLKRVMIGGVSYLITLLLVVVFWWLNYFSVQVITTYVAMIATVNLGFYGLIRSGLNRRFKDPSLTLAQILISAPTGFFVMYHAHEARGVFMLLSLSASVYGLFQFHTRDFIIMSVAWLGGYALLILVLTINRPTEIQYQVEILQLVALAAALVQFSALGGYIGRLRQKVKEKNLELENRNKDLERALSLNEELAIRDDLTGLFNRRHLMEIIRIEKQRCDRTRRTFSICILDVDFFKKINDTFGHLAGDDVLKSIAKTTSDGLRQSDSFGRYGGEEFALILTDTSVDGALVTCERIRTTIEGLNFHGISEELKVTVSIGIAESRADEDTNLTFKRADEALYRAKEQGRNQCVTSTG